MFTFKGTFVRVHPLVNIERPLAGAGITALAALQRLDGLVLTGVVSQGGFGGTLKVTFRATEGVDAAVLKMDVGF